MTKNVSFVCAKDELQRSELHQKQITVNCKKKLQYSYLLFCCNPFVGSM